MRAISLNRSKFESNKSKMRTAFDTKLRNYQQEATEKARFAAIYVARELAELTFPSPNAIGFAVAAMRFDVSRVYCTAGKAYEILKQTAGVQVAGAFYAAYRNGQISQAREVLRASNSPIRDCEIGSLRPELHEKSRDPKTGRVMLAHPLQIVQKAELDSYLRSAIARIGKTASGWNACAAKLGGSESGFRWKSTAVHGSDGGVVTQTGGSKAAYVINNVRPLARKHISPGQVDRIVKAGELYYLQMLAAK